MMRLDANVLFQQANLNETFVDGDAKSVSLLVLSMQKCWDQRRGFFPGGTLPAVGPYR